MADRYGKVKIFRILAIASLIPLLVTTNLMPVPLWVVLINSTAFFILISGRMIPAMAIASQMVEAKIRGTFMSLVGSVQMLASGLASVIAGLLIENTEKLSVARIAHTKLTEEISELNRDQILLNNHIMLTRFGTIKGKIAGVSMALNLMLDTSPGSEKLNTKNALLVNAIGLLSEANEEIKRLDLEKHNV
jgi:MFS family permease